MRFPHASLALFGMDKLTLIHYQEGIGLDEEDFPCSTSFCGSR